MGRKRRRPLGGAPTFFHILHVAIATDPVVHFLTVRLLAASQHGEGTPRLLHHIHDTVQQLQRGRERKGWENSEKGCYIATLDQLHPKVHKAPSLTLDNKTNMLFYLKV